MKKLFAYFKAGSSSNINTGQIPKPIIVLQRNGIFEIVDGNHRIAALLHVGIPPNYKIPMWMPKQENKCTTSACTLSLAPPAQSDA